uniref:Uncharacterized protein n=1 Tax=Kalanchoe fedtschenkoi TaxID=63787 RepID=A0A7N0V6B8_KALFE
MGTEHSGDIGKNAEEAGQECMASSRSHLSAVSQNPKGHLVYVRRKHDSDLSKGRAPDKINGGSFLEVSERSQSVLSSQQQASPTSTSAAPSTTVVPSLISTSGSPLIAFPENQHHKELVSGTDSVLHHSANGSHPQLHDLSIQPQICSKNYDYESYVKMLHALTPDERSKYAVELERRAIHLSHEEVRENRRAQLLLGTSYLK